MSEGTFSLYMVCKKVNGIVLTMCSQVSHCPIKRVKQLLQKYDILSCPLPSSRPYAEEAPGSGTTLDSATHSVATTSSVDTGDEIATLKSIALKNNTSFSRQMAMRFGKMFGKDRVLDPKPPGPY